VGLNGGDLGLNGRVGLNGGDLGLNGGGLGLKDGDLELKGGGCVSLSMWMVMGTLPPEPDR
jgi:hypothetical protein